MFLGGFYELLHCKVGERTFAAICFMELDSEAQHRPWPFRGTLWGMKPFLRTVSTATSPRKTPATLLHLPLPRSPQCQPQALPSTSSLDTMEQTLLMMHWTALLPQCRCIFSSPAWITFAICNTTVVPEKKWCQGLEIWLRALVFLALFASWTLLQFISDVEGKPNL